MAVIPLSHTWLLGSCPEVGVGCHMNGVLGLESVAWRLRVGGRGGAGLGDTHENAIPCLQSFHGQKEAETLMESDAAPLYPSPHSRILVTLGDKFRPSSPSHLHSGRRWGSLIFGDGE